MITLTAYNDTWPTLFESEKLKIQQALGNRVAHVEHIGSTAIPGIYAKPIIDILVGVNHIDQFTQQDIHQIELLGYHYNPIFEKEFPHRRYFQKAMRLETEHIKFIWSIILLPGGQDIFCSEIIYAIMLILQNNMNHLN